MSYEKIAVAAILTLALWIMPAVAEGQSFKVVINENNSTASMTQQNLSKCFLKQTRMWANGIPVIPVDQAVGSDTRKAFSQQIHERDVSAIKSYWQRQIFSGRGVPPTEKTSDEEVLIFVKSNAGAVGYVSQDADLGTGVKVLEIADL